MRFHESLLAMRARGSKPESIFLVVDCADEEDAHWFDRDPGHAVIAIDPTDSPNRLDLRCLVGCTVVVQGFDERRLESVFNAAIAAGASKVAAVFRGDVHIHTGESHGRNAA